jgi:hypothetical protein
MALRDLYLFLLVCLLAGSLTVAGSVLGHAMGPTGLFVGAVIGGFAGVGLAVWLATRIGFLPPANLPSALIGGCAGFIVAAIIAVNSLWTPIIPLASIALTGVGALLGKAIGQRRAARGK